MHPLLVCTLSFQDVKVFEVLDADNSHIGIFYIDYFPRPGKRAGAWMSSYKDQYVENGVDIRLINDNVGNFSKLLGHTLAFLIMAMVEPLSPFMLRLVY